MMQLPSRRQALSLFGTAVAYGTLDHAASAALAAQSDGSLGDVAARAGLLFGAAIDNSALEDPAYGELYARETRLLTSENAFKLAALRRGPNAADLDFSNADLILDFAERRKLPLRAHTLIWNDDTPAWAASLSAREVESLFDSHIDAVASRYAGRIFAYDVVNEPLYPWRGASADGYRRGIWFDTLGPSYIPRAFKRVAAIDCSAKLVLNEAFTERGDAVGAATRSGLLRLIDDLLDKGTPLHAVGLQGHLQPQYGIAFDAFGELLQEIGRRGLDIHITELDVDDSSLPIEAGARDKSMAGIYARFASTVWPNVAVRTLVTWDLSDRYSWYRSPVLARRMPAGWSARPLLFDDRLTRKPAYLAVRGVFEARRA